MTRFLLKQSTFAIKFSTFAGRGVKEFTLLEKVSWLSSRADQRLFTICMRTKPFNTYCLGSVAITVSKQLFTFSVCGYCDVSFLGYLIRTIQGCVPRQSTMFRLQVSGILVPFKSLPWSHTNLNLMAKERISQIVTPLISSSVEYSTRIFWIDLGKASQ